MTDRREALRESLKKREAREAELNRLRRLWDEGKASGPPRPFDLNRMLSKASSSPAAPQVR